MRKTASVLLGSIRQNTRTRIFLLETATVLYSFTASAFRSDWPSLRDDPEGLIRLAIPAVTVLLVLLLRNGFAGRGQRGQIAPVIDIVIAFACALLSQSVLTAVAPELALPRWAPTQGSFVGWMFLAGLRAIFPPGPPCLPALATSFYLDEMQYKTRGFEEDIRRRNRVAWLIGAAVFGAFSLYFFRTHTLNARAGSALVLAGVTYLLFEICWRGQPEKIPASANLEVYASLYQAELQRQSKLLRRTWYCYFGALIPGGLLLLRGAPVYPYDLLLCVLLLAEMHLRAAETLTLEQYAGNASGHKIGERTHDHRFQT